jgi:2-succinyl-5-enolpyruvyl-6-hydroxy-3-cyclohexene-1-carboxylate synthase
VILCNGGGRLFDLLPVRDALSGDPASYSRFFHTPPEVSPSAAARAFDIPAATVGSTVELADAIAESHARPGSTVIEARLDGPPTAEWVHRLEESVGGA